VAIVAPPGAPGGFPPRTPPYPGGGPTLPNSPGTGGGSSGSGGGVYVPVSYGGVFATAQASLFPCLNTNTGFMEFRTWDTTVPPNDPLLASSYTWKMEDLAAYRTPTLRRLVVTFRDLGQVATVWTATSENQQTQQTQQTSVGWGNAVPTMRIMSTPVDLSITGQLIQVSVTRAAGAGPLAIVKLTLAFQVEEVSL
jgi:hypothetical protein